MGPQASHGGINRPKNNEILMRYYNLFRVNDVSTQNWEEQMILYEQVLRLFTDPKILFHLFKSSEDPQYKISYVIVDCTKNISIPEKFKNNVKGFCMNDIFFTWTDESIVFLYKIFPEDLLFECVLKVWKNEEQFNPELRAICDIIARFNRDFNINIKSLIDFSLSIFRQLRIPLRMSPSVFFDIVESIQNSMLLADDDFFVELTKTNNEKQRFESHREFDEYVSQLKSHRPDIYISKIDELRLLHTAFTFKFKQKLLFKNDRYLWALPGDDIWEPSPYGCPFDNMNDLVNLPELIVEQKSNVG
eukprot:TRINITY_DN280_c0_g1_i1.p1 TRINITY_DN280_c0_g1~~TRINITY_DN280_c0_g1_i1.p1  ORF type:complete len:304 (-),score=48.85 TRINITY_DN280_c0_g1_i1:390-1301(-)